MYTTRILALVFINSSLVSDIYVGSDGNLHKVQGGADTVLPFNVESYKISTFTVPSTQLPSQYDKYISNAKKVFISFTIKASTSGGYITINDTRIAHVSGDYGKTNTLNGLWQSSDNLEDETIIVYGAQFGGTITITELF